jgi:hypothetical protein
LSCSFQEPFRRPRDLTLSAASAGSVRSLLGMDGPSRRRLARRVAGLGSDDIEAEPSTQIQLEVNNPVIREMNIPSGLYAPAAPPP